MAAAIPYIIAAASIYGGIQQYQTGKRQEEAQRQLEREAAISPEEAQRYNALANQLAWMAGLDPTQFFVQPTGPYAEGVTPPNAENLLMPPEAKALARLVRPQPGATVDLPTAPEGTFQAISDEAINEVIAQAQRDLATQAGTLGEQALAQAARRGLAGSSLVDQALANIGAQSARELSRTRTQAELSAEELTRQYGQQALQMLMGLNPNDLQSLQVMSDVLTGLQKQLAGQAASWGDLVSGGLQYFLNQYGPLATIPGAPAPNFRMLEDRSVYNPFK